MWIAKQYNRDTGLSTGWFQELNGDDLDEAKEDLFKIINTRSDYNTLCLPSQNVIYYKRYYYVIENTEETELSRSNELGAQAC